MTFFWGQDVNLQHSDPPSQVEYTERNDNSSLHGRLPGRMYIWNFKWHMVHAVTKCKTNTKRNVVHFETANRPITNIPLLLTNCRTIIPHTGTTLLDTRRWSCEMVMWSPGRFPMGFLRLLKFPPTQRTTERQHRCQLDLHRKPGVWVTSFAQH